MKFFGNKFLLSLLMTSVVAHTGKASAQNKSVIVIGNAFTLVNTDISGTGCSANGVGTLDVNFDEESSMAFVSNTCL